MWRDPEPGESGAAAGPGAGTAAARRHSPALLAFALNPFRILRVAASATTAESALGAERILTLARADMSPDIADPLPWLPLPGFPELQQAAQSIEEPLLRLRHQLLWFDFERDSEGPALAAALRDHDWPALAAYLALESPAPADAGSPDDVARAVNQANLHLLLATTKVNGLWADDASSARPIQPIEEKAWQAVGGLRGLPQAHLTVIGALPDQGAEIHALWKGGLSRWTAILNDPAFRGLVEAHIRALDDDFAHADDAEAVEESIRTYLADLCAQEIRFLLVEGRYGAATALVASIAESGLEPRVLTPAMRPIRQFLQAELGELDPLLAQEEEDRRQPIAAYLQRLVVIRDRWLALDEAGVLGLREVVDRAVERIYQRLRQWRRSGEQTDDLLAQAGLAASAQSLRERIASLRTQHQEMRERVCHFCKTRDPDYDNSVVLKGKKETGREQTSYNEITVYYAIRHALILRCARCATLHDFIRKISMMLATLTVALIAAILWIFLGMSPPRYAVPVSSDYSPSPDYYNEANLSDMNLSDVNLSEPLPVEANLGDLSEPSNSSGEETSLNTLVMRRPSPNNILSLTMSELRYCLAEDVRITAMSGEMDRLRASNVSRYNRNVTTFNDANNDYNSRCASRSYPQSDGPVAEAEVGAERASLEAEGRARVR